MCEKDYLRIVYFLIQHFQDSSKHVRIAPLKKTTASVRSSVHIEQEQCSESTMNGDNIGSSCSIPSTQPASTSDAHCNISKQSIEGNRVYENIEQHRIKKRKCPAVQVTEF